MSQPLDGLIQDFFNYFTDSLTSFNYNILKSAIIRVHAKRHLVCTRKASYIEDGNVVFVVQASDC